MKLGTGITPVMDVNHDYDNDCFDGDYNTFCKLTVTFNYGSQSKSTTERYNI